MEADAHWIAELASMMCCVTVADLRRALLEGGVDEAQVGVVLGLGVHSGANQVLNCHLDGAHVDAAAEVQVLVEQVTCI